LRMTLARNVIREILGSLGQPSCTCKNLLRVWIKIVGARGRGEHGM
jgi:hypothetical protein